MLPRPIQAIRADIAENKRWTAAGGEVAAGSLASLEAELRAATGRRPVRSTKPWPVTMTYCRGCRTSGIPGQRCRCPLTPKAPARHYTLPELRARAHAFLDAEALSDPERLIALPYGAVRDQALRSIEAHGQHLPPAEIDRLEALCRERTAEFDGKVFSRYVALTTSPAYVRAFEKTLRYVHPTFDPDEGAAVNAWHAIAPRATQEERAMGEGGSAALAIPVLIDPTILVQSQDNAEILSAQYGAKQVTIVTDAWHGVSSGGATLAFKGEGIVAADANVTLAQPTIPVYTASGDFAMSIELFEDYPNLVGEVGSMFGSAYRDQVSNYTSIGSGTSAPTGLFTALSNQSTSPSHIKVSSAGTLVAGDVRAVFAVLPERYQLNASWLMSPSMVQAVAALAAPSVTNGLAPHDYVPQGPNQPARLLGRPVLVSSYAPSFANATSGTFNWIVVGDLSRYLVVNRIGSSLELVPTMFDFAGGTGRPTGQRSYLYVTRWGAAPTDLLAHRILANS